jgi:hypothetical protein
VFAACDDAPRAAAETDATSDLAPSDTDAPAAPTYHRDIAPLLDRHCTTCHAPGLAGPFRLDTLDEARHHAEFALVAMQSGTMPPWMPDRDCRTYADERGMSPDEVAQFSRWLEAGLPEGDPADAPPRPEREPWTPTLVLPISEDHLPSGELEDDYRCFLLGDGAAQFDHDTYLRASQVAPGSSQVHHVLVYAVAPERADDLISADLAADGAGYPCFGGPIPGGAETADFSTFFAGGPLPDLTLPTQVGSWVPGARPRIYPDGQAIRIRAGSTLVAQVHYNLTEGRPLPDSSKIEMVLSETPPTTLVEVRPLAVRALTIPAGDAAAVNIGWFPYYGETPRLLASVTGHMHLLGSRFLAEVVRADAPEAAPECALDIPRWDFHWQQSYTLRDDDRITLNDGDGIRVTCEYDNSAENQLVVGGVRAEPVDVTWGEGTRDEMCILYHAALTPYAPVPPASDTPCGPAAACLEACDTPSFDCLFRCAAASASCQLCGLRAGLRCSAFACVPELRAAGDCLGRCIGANVMLTSNTGRCLAAECADAYDALLGCIDAPLADAPCAALDECGVNFQSTAP